jgi:hypothetical protein
MTCKPCVNGDHKTCEKGTCECHLLEQGIANEIAQQTNADVAMAEIVYSTLLYGGSKCAAMLTEGAGRDAVCLFVQQIITTYKAVNN